MTNADRAGRSHLPIRARIDQAVHLAGRPGPDSWRPVAVFPLGVTG